MVSSVSLIPNTNLLVGLFLTSIHFAITSAIMMCLAQLGIYQRKRLPWQSVIPLSMSFCGFVVLTNLSLKYNSVAFYQMMKVLTTPIVALIQFFGYGIGMQRGIRLALGFTCIGVLVATAEEVAVSFLGSGVAFVSVFVTALYQVLVGSKHQSLEADSMQLLAYQAPISALMLLVLTPMMEDATGILAFPYTSGLIVAIIGSGVLAALVNVSTFLIIGHTSAITYNVVGHCKLCLVLLFGFLLFDHQALSSLNISGILVAICGITSYSYIKLKG